MKYSSVIFNQTGMKASKTKTMPKGNKEGVFVTDTAVCFSKQQLIKFFSVVLNQPLSFVFFLSRIFQKLHLFTFTFFFPSRHRPLNRRFALWIHEAVVCSSCDVNTPRKSLSRVLFVATLLSMLLQFFPGL